jgi:hypothetical protein
MFQPNPHCAYLFAPSYSTFPLNLYLHYTLLHFLLGFGQSSYCFSCWIN